MSIGGRPICHGSEAAIQSAHVEGVRTGAISWAAVVSLYDTIVELTGWPVAGINRALAIAELQGPRMQDWRRWMPYPRTLGWNSYQRYWAARAYLLGHTGSRAEARPAYQLAIGLESGPAVREYLRHRSESLESPLMEPGQTTP